MSDQAVPLTATTPLGARRRSRPLVRGLVATVGIAGWVWVVFFTVGMIWTIAMDPTPHLVWLYDWHVYSASASDLAGRDLYRVALEFPGWPLPVTTYNYPPFSAAWALPFLALPDETAGIVWVVAGALLMVSAWWGALSLMRVPQAWAWTGIGLALYSLFIWFKPTILLGNMNSLVLALVVGFAIAHVRGHRRAAGLLLGVAIATKIWPVALLVPLVRERKWDSASWSVATAAVLTALPVLWLGLDAIQPMLDALRLVVPVEPDNAVLWTTALRGLDWWPAWGAAVIAVLLLLIPARGLTAIGVAMIAGVTLIPNIWHHYLPTLIVGIGFVLAGIPWRHLAVGMREALSTRLFRSAAGRA